jgi:adenylate cyclase
VQRKLAAILAADVVGYSRLMAENEADTFDRLRAHRKELFEPEIAKHHGRIFKLMGDGLLAEFGSVVDAIECAVVLQREMTRRNDGLPNDRRIDLRIGINLGDVIVEGEDRHGDGINIAARLQELAEPGGLAVSGTAYDHLHGKVGIALEFAGEQQVKNIARPVRVYRARLEGTSTAPRATLALPDKPSIAVLPFQNLSGDPEQRYFGDGLVEDIITELSRFRSLFVIARNSSFVFRGEPIDIAEVGRRLGVQYVLEGSIRRAGNRVRITVQLIDAPNGAHLWAERYDRELEDIFAVQDEVVRTVVSTVAGRVEAAGAQVAKRKPPDSLAAYDFLLRGLEQLNLVGEDHNAEARRLFEKAVELDPQYAAAHAYLALTIYVQWTSSRAPGELDRALASARHALALDENDSRCHRILGGIYEQLRDFDRAEFHSERSIALNPNDALATLWRGGLLRCLGRAEEGVDWVRKAMRLNPYHPNWYWSSLARMLHTAGHYAEALAAYGRIADRPSYYHAYVAACHAELGQMGEARAHAALALETRPEFSIKAWGERLTFKNEVDLQRFLNGLRKAGLPE